MPRSHWKVEWSDSSENCCLSHLRVWQVRAAAWRLCFCQDQFHTFTMRSHYTLALPRKYDLATKKIAMQLQFHCCRLCLSWWSMWGVSTWAGWRQYTHEARNVFLRGFSLSTSSHKLPPVRIWQCWPVSIYRNRWNANHQNRIIKFPSFPNPTPSKSLSVYKQRLISGKNP